EQEELLHSHPGRLRGDEVTGLVDDDQDGEAGNYQQPAQATPTSSTRLVESRRASLSAANSCSKWVTGSAGSASSALATTSAIAVNEIRSERKASTATSSAAFNTHGAVPPASPASRASRRQAKVSSSGCSKLSRPTDARSSAGTS